MSKSPKTAVSKKTVRNGKVYGDALSATEKKRIVMQKKKDKHAKKIPKSAQQTIPYVEMCRDGICKVSDCGSVPLRTARSGTASSISGTAQSLTGFMKRRSAAQRQTGLSESMGRGFFPLCITKSWWLGVSRPLRLPCWSSATERLPLSAKRSISMSIFRRIA